MRNKGRFVFLTVIVSLLGVYYLYTTWTSSRIQQKATVHTTDERGKKRPSKQVHKDPNHPINKSFNQKMINIVLLGPPGAGKGTQSQKLIQKYHLLHISPGELLREHVKNNTALGQQVAQYINEGKLAPQKLVQDIVTAKLVAHKTGDGFLFDGFPRTIAQAKELEDILVAQQLQIDLAILIEVPEKEVLDRIQARAQTAGRADDQDTAKVATRMRIYHEETLPLAQYYAQQNKLFKVNGVGEVEQVFEQIVAAIDQALTPQ
ncbi:MAG: adenylate kinase [Bacteroidota bacterium]